MSYRASADSGSGRINKVRQATYLGCQLGIETTNREELNKRISNTMMTMKSLDLFWRHSNCDVALKIYVADAVLRSKLLYGLESAELIPSVLKRLETIQLKVLRKILRLNTTYIDRENTNEKVFEKANDDIRNEGKRKKVIPFTEAYKKFKLKRAGKIIRNTESPLYKISFQGDKLGKWIHAGRRVGRPRANWTEQTVTEIWDHIRKDHEQDKYLAFNPDNEYIINKIHEAAAIDNIIKPTPKTTNNRRNTRPNTPTNTTPSQMEYIPYRSNETPQTRLEEGTEKPETHRSRLCRKSHIASTSRCMRRPFNVYVVHCV